MQYSEKNREEQEQGNNRSSLSVPLDLIQDPYKNDFASVCGKFNPCLFSQQTCVGCPPPLPAPTHSLVVPTSCGGGKPRSSKGSCVTGSLSPTGKGRDNVGEGTEAGEGEQSAIEGRDKESLSRDSGQMTTCRAHAPSWGQNKHRDPRPGSQDGGLEKRRSLEMRLRVLSGLGFYPRYTGKPTEGFVCWFL